MSNTEVSGANFERQAGTKERFLTMDDLHSRYTSIKSRMEEKMKKWENYLKSYRRHAIRRSNGRVDANYGQFKFEIDNASDVFQSLVINRPTWVTITPKEAPDKSTKLEWSHRISECWHDEFIRPWHDKVENTSYDFFDMLMFMAGIEFWPNMGDVYPENVAIETCFPDLMAGVNPQKWETFFILRRMSYIQLQDRLDKEVDGNWNKPELKELLSSKENRTDVLTNFEALRLDTKETQNTDNSILLIYAYVKEYDGKITKYIFPENGVINTPPKGSASPEKKEQRYLMRHVNYCKHIGQVVALRTYHRFKLYWSGESLADNIFLAKLQGDQAQNKILRGAIRSCTTFVNSNNADVQEKLQKQSDEEVIVLDADVKINYQTIPSNTTDLLNAVRQLSFDTERMNRDSMPAGSQNVKGRAITAEEAANQEIQAVEKRSNKTGLFVQNDQRFGDELYRRSMKVTAGEPEGKNLKRFKDKMEYYKIPPEAYEYDNVTLESSFSLMGGNMGARMSATKELLGLTRIKPESRQVFNAKREAIAALTDYSTADFYCADPEPLDESQARIAGFENAALDDPNLNPKNAQVMGNDNHVTHMQLHLPDIENDLQRVQRLLGQYSELPVPSKAVYVYEFQNRMTATDNKFGHAIAHLQMMAVDDGLKGQIDVYEAEMARLRAAYTTMEKMMRQAIDQFAQEVQSNSFMSEEQRLRIEDRQNEVTYRQQLRDVGLGKAVEQVKLSQQRGILKIQQQEEQAASQAKQTGVMQDLQTDGSIKQTSAKLAGQQAKNLIDASNAQVNGNTPSK